MEIAGKHILVVGLGVSGVALVRFLTRRGALVTVTDMSPEAGLAGLLPEVRSLGARLEIGGHREDTFTQADLIVLSPGVPHDILPVQKAAALGVPVIGEIELAGRFIDTPIIAVTGTNGKTTTTSLVSAMLESSGLSVFTGGNIGSPLIGYADGPNKCDRVVAEISSFQLDTIFSFRPNVAVLLNIADDHLDRYADFGAYAQSKARIFENQTEADTAVLRGNDPVIASVTNGLKSRCQTFLHEKDYAASEEKTVAVVRTISAESGFLIQIYCQNNITDVYRIPLQRLPGRHNAENAAAAVLAALAAGGSREGIQAALNSFSLLPHRMELVRTLAGVDYINDSKATNVDAVVRAIESFERPVILILGGRDKGGDYAPPAKPDPTACETAGRNGRSRRNHHARTRECLCRRFRQGCLHGRSTGTGAPYSRSRRFGPAVAGLFQFRHVHQLRRTGRPFS